MPLPQTEKNRWTLAALAVALLAAIAPAHASSEPCQYYAGAGTVTDNKTGLTWQVVASSTQLGEAQAAGACAVLELDSNGPASPHPWRLPTIRELQTLVDEGHVDPAVSPAYFTDTPVGYFWSSTPAANTPGHFWGVYFGPGNTGTAPAADQHYARCVHD
jgi:hypothetical protein